MLVCPQCEAECEESAASCPGCGLSFSSSMAAAAGMSTALMHSAGEGEDDQAGSSRTEVIAGGAAHRIGTTMGSYRLLEVLGEGGMGAVFLAEHVKLGRKVALKMLHPQYADMPEAVRRFFAEARAVNRIFHDHIVEITDFIEDDEGQNYFIMEHLKGAPLGDLMESEGLLPLSRSVSIIVQVCSALSAVHEAGIVHRDLKPDNIFITERAGQKDYVKLLDFGVAKLLDTDGHTLNLQTTAAGMVLGTPEYMSPEQACGKPVDYRTDIYSIGVILYELATGIKPFEAETFGELVVQHSTNPPVPPSKVEGLFQDIPRSLEEVILHCLEKEPQKRPQTTREIEERLREIARTHAVELERFDVSRKRLSPRAKLYGTAGVAVAAAAAVLAFFLIEGGGSGGSAPAPELEEEAAAASIEPETPPESPPEGLQEGAAPAEEPPEPLEPIDKKVSIRITSVPTGAAVFAAGGDEELGTTPFTTELERGDFDIWFEIKKKGYEPLKQSVSASRDAQLAVVLAPSSGKKSRRAHRNRGRGAASKKARARRSSGRSSDQSPKKSGKAGSDLQEGAVMDPFAND